MADVAIECVDVWKNFRIYHERSHTLKERFVGGSNKYETFTALKGINFEVAAGSTLGIIGSNGSGKSTMLKVLARIMTPNKGYVRVNGTMSSLLELGTGFHPDLTGRENVFLASSVLGRSEKETKALYDSIVDFAGVEQFMDLPIKNYSSGMNARLAFAVSISVEPEVLLLDEVLSVGDEEFQMKCFERIAHFRQEGRTIVLVSHSLGTITTMCQDAIWIERGELRGQGPSEDVVAEYLGNVHLADPQAAGMETSDKRWGNGNVQITGVNFLDGTGRLTTNLRGGEAAAIEITYETKLPVDELVAGIAIYRAENDQLVHGQNSVRSEMGYRLPANGTVRFELSELPLLKGPHMLTVALHDRACKTIYDWHEHEYAFSVLDGSRSLGQTGMVYAEGTWSVPVPTA